MAREPTMAWDELRIGPDLKGFPNDASALPVSAVAGLGWSLFDTRFPFPLLTLRAEALERNLAWMQAVLARYPGVFLCPHGKTTMAPQLFRRQVEEGAWGLTLSNVHQVRVARRFGFRRILWANPLVGPSAVRFVAEELARDPDFELLFLIDDVRSLDELAAVARDVGLARPFTALVELGLEGARSGCRSVEAALDLARQVAAAGPAVRLAGIEGFEGLLGEATEVEAYLERFVALAERVFEEGLVAPGRGLLSAGGSAFYDLVLERTSAVARKHGARVLLRSGCYLTHDDGIYAEAWARLRARRADWAIETEPEPALEVWSEVLSRPEPSRAVLSFGKRDASFDCRPPVPKHWFRPGERALRAIEPDVARVVALNDQHAWVELDPTAPDWRPGDRVGCGISHPCLTFDKWDWAAVVDRAGTIVDAVRTFF